MRGANHISSGSPPHCKRKGLKLLAPCLMKGFAPREHDFVEPRDDHRFLDHLHDFLWCGVVHLHFCANAQEAVVHADEHELGSVFLVIEFETHTHLKNFLSRKRNQRQRSQRNIEHPIYNNQNAPNYQRCVRSCRDCCSSKKKY